MATIYANHVGGLTSNNPLAAGGTTLNSANLANLPVVAAPDTMWIVLDADGSAGAPEIVQVTAHTSSATSATIVRGQQGTTARSHVLNTDWVVAATKSDLDELPFRKVTTKGDLLAASAANTITRVAVGSNGTVPVANSSDTAGFSWGQVSTAGIADSAVTTAKIADATIAVGDLSAALLETICPAGTIRTTINTSADTGWLLFGQTVVGASSTYPTLWAKAPASWKSGSDLVLPSDDQMILQGASSGIGGTNGANTVTLSTANLPSHTHTMDHDHPAGTTSTVSNDHTHGFSGNTGGQSNSHYHAPGDPGNHSAFQTVSWTGFDYGIVGGGNANSTGTTDWASHDHSHGFSGNTGGISANHTHTFDVANHSGSTGATGSGSAVSTQQAAIKVRFQIKAH